MPTSHWNELGPAGDVRGQQAERRRRRPRGTVNLRRHERLDPQGERDGDRRAGVLGRRGEHRRRHRQAGQQVGGRGGRHADGSGSRGRGGYGLRCRRLPRSGHGRRLGRPRRGHEDRRLGRPRRGHEDRRLGRPRRGHEDRRLGRPRRGHEDGGLAGRGAGTRTGSEGFRPSEPDAGSTVPPASIVQRNGSPRSRERCGRRLPRPVDVGGAPRRRATTSARRSSR